MKCLFLFTIYVFQICHSGCQCNKGFLLNAKGKCVTPDKCNIRHAESLDYDYKEPKIKCPKHMKWTTCGRLPTCDFPLGSNLSVNVDLSNFFKRINLVFQL